jgi:hypothetical protein
LTFDMGRLTFDIGEDPILLSRIILDLPGSH